MKRRKSERVKGGAAGEEALEAIADRLHSVAIRLLRTVRAEDNAAGQSGPRLSALSVLVFRGPLRIGDLAAAEQVRPPTMTRLVQALEEGGLVRREPDAADRRQVWVHATAQGRRLLEQGRRRRVRAVAAKLEVLPGAELDVVRKAVSALETALRG